MSVAFRRESDEEHREPRFERPIPSGPNLVTPRGLRLIGERVAELEAALVNAGQEQRSELAREHRYWRTRLVTAVEAPPPGAEEVTFGSRIRVSINGAMRLLEIVGHDEAEPATDRIAYSAPLARALIGSGSGDVVEFGGSVIAVIELVGGFTAP